MKLFKRKFKMKGLCHKCYASNVVLTIVKGVIQCSDCSKRKDQQ